GYRGIVLPPAHLLFPVQTPGLAAWTSAGQRSRLRRLLLLISQHSGFVIGSGFPLRKGNGPGGTGRQAVSQTVAVIVPQKLGFAIHHADSTFVTGFGTGATSVTFFFVNMDNLSNHFTSSVSGRYPGSN